MRAISIKTATYMLYDVFVVKHLGHFYVNACDLGNRILECAMNFEGGQLSKVAFFYLFNVC